MKKQHVAYYRVSTVQQGASGLGLEAQKIAVRTFTGCPDGSCIQAEFTEVESGRKNKRPVLLQALNYAKQNKCTLVISKLDRLSRNAAFLHSLKDSGVDFKCCDIPELNTLTLGVMASIAQWEAEKISERTKQALAARKARGLKNKPNFNLTPERRGQGHKAVKENARTAIEVQQVLPRIQELRRDKKSYRVIAADLNARQFKTRTGKYFDATGVMRVEKRFRK